MKLYKKYSKKKIKIDFIDWLLEKDELDNEQIENIKHILNLYNDITDEIKNYPYKAITYKNIDIEDLKNVLKKERFVF